MLTGQLAAHYHKGFVSEYARAYIAALDRPYLLEDIIAIAKAQLKQEKEGATKNKLLFCDTTLLVTKIWAENAFKVCPDFISLNWRADDYKLHLLMQIDLPWQYDKQREHPDQREFFFDWYERELKSSGANYRIIEGTEKERLKNAIKVVDVFLKSLR